MAQAQFPQLPDLDVPFNQKIGDGTNISFAKHDVSNPHPGFGKDPNILNEYGHTMYPKYVGDVIVQNEAEEKALLNKEAPAAAPAAPEGWGK